MLYKKQYPTDDYSDIDVSIENSEKNLAHLKSIDKIQEAKGESLLYRYFSRPVADGMAWYQVTKATTTTATVQWCDGICLDNYQDGMLGYGGTVPIDMVFNMVSLRIEMDKLFSR
jgi:hypothetical protein